MKVTIDTKEDSHEDIRKVLHILTNILENKDSNYKVEEKVDTTSMMSMFSENTQKSAEPVKETEGTAPDFTSFLNLQNTNRKEDDDELPRVEYF